MSRGFEENQSITINLPIGYKVNHLLEKIKKETKFGIYEINCATKDNSIVYERKLILFQNKYEKTDFEAFRLFLDEIARYDNAKIALIK